MDLFKWESLLPMEALFGENLPSLASAGMDLAADVYEKDNGVYVELHMPGIMPDAYDIQVEDGMLIVSGKRKKDTEVQDQQYYRKEIQRGSFERRVSLPEKELNTTDLKPMVENGVLKVFIPLAS